MADISVSRVSMKRYVEKLAEASASPGGGSAVCCAASYACALIAMIAGISCRNKKYCKFRVMLTSVLKKSQTYASRFLDLADRDTAAFADYSRKRLKSHEDITRIPLEVVGLSLDMFDMLLKIIGKTSINLRPDLRIAAAFFDTAVRGSFANIEVNLDGMSNSAFRRKSQQRYTRYKKLFLEKKRRVEKSLAVEKN